LTTIATLIYDDGQQDVRWAHHLPHLLHLLLGDLALLITLVKDAMGQLDGAVARIHLLLVPVWTLVKNILIFIVDRALKLFLNLGTTIVKTSKVSKTLFMLLDDLLLSRALLPLLLLPIFG
jgi:hypothetical protein